MSPRLGRSKITSNSFEIVTNRDTLTLPNSFTISDYHCHSSRNPPSIFLSSAWQRCHPSPGFFMRQLHSLCRRCCSCCCQRQGGQTGLYKCQKTGYISIKGGHSNLRCRILPLKALSDTLSFLNPMQLLKVKNMAT